MTQLFRSACTSCNGEAADITIAPIIRWPNAQRLLQAAQHSATLTPITLVRRRRRRDEVIGVIAKSDRYRQRLLGRIATACKDANAATLVIVSSPAVPNAWRQRAVPTLVAGLILSTRSRASGVAPIPNSEQRSYRASSQPDIVHTLRCKPPRSAW
jgi:hypothetical protein